MLRFSNRTYNQILGWERYLRAESCAPDKELKMTFVTDSSLHRFPASTGLHRLVHQRQLSAGNLGCPPKAPDLLLAQPLAWTVIVPSSCQTSLSPSFYNSRLEVEFMISDLR